MYILNKLLQDIRHRKDLIFYLTKSELKSNTARTYMGFLWWILDPILYMAVFYVLVQVILGRGGENFAVFLFVALIPLKWTISCLVDSTTAISSKAGIIKQVYVPKIIFILVRLTVNTIKFLISSVMLFLFLWIYDLFISPLSLSYYALFYSVIVIVHMVFLLAVMVLLSHIGVYIKDVKNLMQYAARMLFYMSPVLFSIDDVPETLAKWLYINPLTTLIVSYRNILIYEQLPQWEYLAILVVIALVTLYIGLKLLFKYENQYAKVI